MSYIYVIVTLEVLNIRNLISCLLNKCGFLIKVFILLNFLRVNDV